MTTHEIEPGLYWRWRYLHSQAEQAREQMDQAVRALRAVRAEVEAACEGVSFDRSYVFLDDQHAIMEK